MKEKYLISAIVSTYKSERFIRHKIENLLKQTIADLLEIVIVNSGSPQNEDAIIKEYLPVYPNIKYIHTEERETIYKAWNRGIRVTTGKYITNSNTDDRLKNDALEKMTTYLENNLDIALVYANQIISKKENEEYEKIKKKEIILFPEYNKMRLLNRCIIGSQPVWRASLHYEDGLWFDEGFEVCGDHDFELAVSHKYEIKHLNEPLGTFYKSPLRTNKEYENIHRNILELNRLREKHVQYYIKNVAPEILKVNINEIKKYLFIPFPFYAFMAKALDVFYRKRFYRPMLVYSVEFIVCLYREVAQEWGQTMEVYKINKRYNRYLKYKNVIVKVRDVLRKHYAKG